MPDFFDALFDATVFHATDLSDLVVLETKILEIVGQIQELGVCLGDFDEGNSIGTVHYSLRERKAAVFGPRIVSFLFGVLE